MSEYQYYEFVAIDEPLTPKQMAELRSRSSRASITLTAMSAPRHGCLGYIATTGIGLTPASITNRLFADSVFL